MSPSRGGRRGYLLSVVAAGLAVITVGCLIVAAYASTRGDRNEEYLVRLKALHAAESGLLAVEQKMVGKSIPTPSSGTFLAGEFPRSGARYRTEVLSEHLSAGRFRVLSLGRAETSDRRVITVELKASYKLVPKKGWSVEWRALQ